MYNTKRGVPLASYMYWSSTTTTIYYTTMIWFYATQHRNHGLLQQQYRPSAYIVLPIKRRTMIENNKVMDASMKSTGSNNSYRVHRTRNKLLESHKNTVFNMKSCCLSAVEIFSCSQQLSRPPQQQGDFSPLPPSKSSVSPRKRRVCMSSGLMWIKLLCAVLPWLVLWMLP